MWHGDQVIPCGAAGFDDGVVIVEHAQRQVIFSQVLPDVLGRVQFGRIGWQGDQGDVAGSLQLGAGVPAGTVDYQRAMGAGGDGAADLLEVQLHRLGVGVRQHQGSAGGALGADGGEDIGPFIARVARAAWPRTDPRPNPGQRTLLADPRFVLEADFQRLGADPGR